MAVDLTTGERLVPVLAALAQATRLKIVVLVADTGKQGVAAGEIARAIRCPASTLSFHLKELNQAGVLEARPRGRYVIYVLQHRALGELAQFVASLDAIGHTAATRRRGPQHRRSGRPMTASDRGQLTMFGD